MVKCDRCGREYVYEPYNWSVMLKVYMKYPDICQNSNIIDLCPDCQEELKTWLEKGVNNGKA